MEQNAETGARGKEGLKHTQTHQKIADVGHQSACAVAVHRQDGATLVGVVRALVKPVAAVIQNIVHKNGMLAFRPDRKSTRLNSSHVRISYAVFCLKKKI